MAGGRSVSCWWGSTSPGTRTSRRGRRPGDHPLEVNHIPDVTVFHEIREAFLALAARWIGDLPGA